MSDFIDREDAVNAIYHHFPSMSKQDAEMVLYEVQSIHPPVKYTIYSMDSELLNKNENRELIDRQAAIEAIHREADRLESGGAIPHGQGARGMAFVIGLLPSAEPQERTGKWIMTWNKWFKADLPVCSSCSVGSPYKTKFCPNCGARMEVEHD